MALLEDRKLDSFPVRINRYANIFLNWKMKNIGFGKMEETRYTLTCMQCSQIICNFIAFENVS